jgi:hypothetical protein
MFTYYAYLLCPPTAPAYYAHNNLHEKKTHKIEKNRKKINLYMLGLLLRQGKQIALSSNSAINILYGVAIAISYSMM